MKQRDQTEERKPSERRPLYITELQPPTERVVITQNRLDKA